MSYHVTVVANDSNNAKNKEKLRQKYYDSSAGVPPTHYLFPITTQQELKVNLLVNQDPVVLGSHTTLVHRWHDRVLESRHGKEQINEERKRLKNLARSKANLACSCMMNFEISATANS